MGVNKWIVGGVITTIASEAMNKVSEELENDRKSKEEIVREQEHTKRLEIEANAEARRNEELHAIKMMRINNPINVVCPRCNAHREVDRVAGSLKCLYCDYVEPLNVAHLYNEAIDGPIVEDTQVDQTDTDDKNGKALVDKTKYCLLCFFLGAFGVHKFYANKKTAGILYLVFCWTYIPWIISLVELVMAVGKQSDSNGKIMV